MGGGGSKSKSSTTTTTTSVVDSYNTTLEQVANLSNVGNISIGSGGDGALLGADSLKSLLVVGAVGLGAWFIMSRF